jgi:hypothetical protein
MRQDSRIVGQYNLHNPSNPHLFVDVVPVGADAVVVGAQAHHHPHGQVVQGPHGLDDVAWVSGWVGGWVGWVLRVEEGRS